MKEQIKECLQISVTNTGLGKNSPRASIIDSRICRARGRGRAAIRIRLMRGMGRAWGDKCRVARAMSMTTRGAKQREHNEQTC